MLDNYIGDDGMSSISDGLQHNKSLTKLDVTKCGVSAKGNYHIMHNYKQDLNIICSFYA